MFTLSLVLAANILQAGLYMHMYAHTHERAQTRMHAQSHISVHAQTQYELHVRKGQVDIS